MTPLSYFDNQPDWEDVEKANELFPNTDGTDDK